MAAIYNAVMRVRINLKSVLVYCTYALAAVFINGALPGVPFSLGLCFAMLICGANIAAVPVLYALASIISLDWVTIVLSLFEGGFLCLVTLLYRRSGRKIRAEAAAYMAIALAPFVAFSRWQGIDSLYFTDNVYIIKAVAAIAVMLFTFFSTRCVYSLFFRLFRCMLRPDELLCISAVAALCGTGIYNLAGQFAYVCICAGLIPLAVRLYRSPASLVVACVLALPLTIGRLDINYFTYAVILSLACLIFSGAGRGAPPAVSLALAAAFMYFSGAFGINVALTVIYALLLLCCCFAAALPSDARLSSLRDLIYVKKQLDRVEEYRFRDYVSRRLFRMSEVFREIELAFTALDEGIDETALRRRMLTEVKEKLCAGCQRRGVCAKTNVYGGIASLIEVGCMKGKVSLVDLPKEITVNCSQAGALIDAINANLAEYRKLTLENYNVKSGRKLLAGQAKGVAEVLKGHAVELAREQDNLAPLEDAVIKELAACGISCPEIRISGGEQLTVLATAVGRVNPAAMAAIIGRTTGTEVLLKDRIPVDAQKNTYIFVRPPRYDAAFGVAYAIKEGERVSGDTHSVIDINEHCFLMALSDGMGSGRYARKVSSTAISLIEAFYRAEMPPEIVLDTINKLLWFNREERFTCIDVAAIDLNTLAASFIKIGSPAGVIVRKGEIKVLESNSLPLGILDSLHPTTCSEQLRCDDIVVFMSDGVTSAFSTPQDLYTYLQTLTPLNPQSLADDILNAAKKRQFGTPDDMTVLCVRIFERQSA